MINKLMDRIFRRKLSYQRLFFGDQVGFTVEGKIVINDLIRYCNVKNSTVKRGINNSNIDPVSVAFEEGKRAVFNHILKVLNTSNEAIINMYKEAEDNE